MQYFDMAKGDALPDEVEVNLNVLGSLMLHRVAGHVDSTDVITVHNRGAAEGSVQLKQ